ncbi:MULTISPECIES: hypothetical protein [Bacillus]|uniref:Uncharacterized protein n=2 Tax=Bacillus TaxID=1386 RepID=A0A0M3RAC1_9BACI|nr:MULTISPECIES: hypothetical protein [Bacillus]ALC82916.1 hypothetical protein AM592_15965 [Bacillus gobiensis]MBP1081896.1 hypothetical protein [Bacillus capparidis]MED1096543.1 hypothetical protein [Bacillus capparidis]
MRQKACTYVLVLLITLIGLELGGGIYEEIVVASVWSSSPTQSFALLQAENGLPLHHFWMPLHLISQVVILLALLLCWKEPHRRDLILTAILGYVVLRVPTFPYFIPELQSFT